MILPAPHRFLPRHAGVWLPPLGLALGSLLACAWLQMQAAPGARVLALLYPPWWGTAHSFMAAGQAGRVIRFGLLPNIVIIAPESGAAPPGATGAWAVLDPRALGGCGTSTKQDALYD